MARVGGGKGPESGFRHAQEDDLPLCQSSLERLHALGIKHGDINKHNFLVHDGRITIIDFDAAFRPAITEELKQEMQRLLEQLRDTRTFSLTLSCGQVPPARRPVASRPLPATPRPSDLSLALSSAVEYYLLPTARGSVDPCPSTPASSVSS
ncbi:hypothetical protein DL546_009369 [Coniochaeta pulveracea]|uniref:Protein kinase domain-containing protein n=1 Tax=Coniochaeta pulveracea TaxID=177199 RepID=A0A420YIK8_9PEZI|nr:hypothetical protein DL546_009369 [Coniochaeta pulveracea]